MPDHQPDAARVSRSESPSRRMLDLFTAADPEAMMSVPRPPIEPARQWYRYTARETAVHRWEVRPAHDTRALVDAELAADHLGDVLSRWLPSAAATYGPYALSEKQAA